MTVTPPTPTPTCNHSTVGDQTATPTDGTCTATLPAGSTAEQMLAFDRACFSIPSGIVTVDIDTGVRTCTFPSPPT